MAGRPKTRAKKEAASRARAKKATSVNARKIKGLLLSRAKAEAAGITVEGLARAIEWRLLAAAYLDASTGNHTEVIWVLKALETLQKVYPDGNEDGQRPMLSESAEAKVLAIIEESLATGSESGEEGMVPS